jgi:signal transduction histidine kinase
VGDDLELITVGPGQYVGEIALVDGGPRSGTVTTVEPSDLFVLSRESFLRLLQSSPHVLSTVLGDLTRMVRNTTERVASQQVEQRMLRADMEVARHRALTEMVAGVAHELNTPLGIARTAASVLRTRITSGDVEDVIEAGELIERNIERAHRLVEEFKLLSVSQVSDRLEVLDLPSVVGEVVELFSISARRAGIRVVILNELHGDTAWHGYRGRLSQVLLNLLTNVERYAYPDGTGGDVEIVVNGSDVGFEIGVHDHGRGIDAADLPRVFDPFFTTGRGRGGTGLGLAIVSGLVRDGLGGTIDIASSPGAGTSVTLRFPRAQRV